MAQNSQEAIAQLKEFGYAFNADGELRKIDPTTGEAGKEPFVFEVSKDLAQNQKHYEKLADQIPEIIYALLEQNGLKRTYVPLDTPPEQATFVFVQPEKLENSKKLLVLIHGSGYVRAGQWARKLIINNSLEHGSQLPYIQRAQKLGYDILVTNTNDNDRIVKGKHRSIRGLENPMAHATYVWKNIVMASKPQSVAIVAHSYGGAITLHLAEQYPEFFQQCVFGVAFTDSVASSLPNNCKSHLQKISCNWASCLEPLDTKLQTRDNQVPCVSAGHPEHEWSSYAAMNSVFKFLEENYGKHDSELKE